MKGKFFITLFLTLVCSWSFSQDTATYVPSGEVLKKGVLAHDDENYVEAITQFEQIHPGDTNYIIAQYELANTLFAMNEYEECVKLCKVGISTNSKLTHSYYNLLGTVYDKMDQPQKSIDIYTEGISIFPTNYRLYYNRSVTYKGIENHQKCVDDLKNTIRFNPFHAPSHLALGKYAKEQGEISKAVMCFNIYLMVSGEQNTAILGEINDYLNESYDNTPYEISLSDESFENTDEMLASLATKSRKYKTPNKLQLPYVKQNFLLLTELSKRELGTDFWDTYYVGFYQNIMADNKFNDLMYYNLRTATNKGVVSILEKNIKLIQAFPDYAGSLWQRSTSDRLEMFNGTEQMVHYYWNGSSATEGRGVVVDNEPTGVFQYYYKTGRLNAIGHFDEDGERHGDWVFFHYNGLKSGHETYVEGDVSGIDSAFYLNGILKSTTPYLKGQPHGIETSYYSTGIKSNEVSYTNGKLNGPAKYYSKIGTISYDLTYQEEEIHGDFKQYYDNGQVLEAVQFEKGNRIGKSVKYHKNGEKKSEANYVNGSLTGFMTTWYSNGALKAEAEYLDGVQINSKKTYFNNGQLETEENYDESGKKTGIYKEYDDQGKLNLQLEYKKGDLIAYKVFHKDGSLIKEDKKKGGDFLFENYYSDGTLRTVGSYIPGDEGKDGLWKFYDYNGALSSQTEHAEGMQVGQEIHYYSTGDIYSTTKYQNGKKNGPYIQYYSNGTISEHGFYINNKKEGLWTSYRRNQSISKEIFYVKGKVNGPKYYYAVNGKIDFIDRYKMDVNQGFEIFDTNEVLIQKVVFTGDSSQYHPQFPTGDKIRSFTKKGNIYHGPSTTYYINGQVNSVGQYWNDNKHGNWLNYFKNGQLSSKGKYEYGHKVGDWIYYHETGEISLKETYVNGDLHGKKTWYLKNGKIDSEYTYEHGSRHGISTYYDPNGVVQHIREYAYGKIVSYSYLGTDNKPVASIEIVNETCDCKSYFSNGNPSRIFSMNKENFEGDYLEYYENGQLYSKTIYKDGLRQGTAVLFYENGTIKREKTYVNDQVEGKVIHYAKDGTIEKTEMYLQGIRHGEVNHYSNGSITSTNIYYDGHQISK
ncbi:MAG: hypothetical protein ACPGRC_08240 [Salibacteraceae bacterium]